MEEEIKNIYQCKECGLHYKDKGLSEKCEAWCKEHKTCNVQITNQSEENKKNASSSAKASEDELKELEKRCEEYLNNWKRERADFLNYKKDEAERMVNLIRYEKEDMILEILPILDSIDLAEKQLPENLKRGEGGSPQAIEWTKGFMQIKKQMDNFLKKQGVEEIKTEGQKFNPETMEAVGEAPARAGGESGDEGTIVEKVSENQDQVSGGQTPEESGAGVVELQKGYMLNGKVIRPAKVKVIK